MYVSRLCLGTMTFGNPIAEAESKDLVSCALDLGINFFDTANVYEGYNRTFGSPGGLGEELLGKALAGRRDAAVICTKFGNPIGLGPLDAGLSARHLEAQLEKSLRRLKTDRLDVVLAHRWDCSVPVEELWRTFERWIKSGKVLQVGVSNWPAWRIAQASEIALRNGLPPIAMTSSKYNLLNRQSELEHIPCAEHYGISLVPYQPFQGGILTGKYRKSATPAEHSRAFEQPGWFSGIDDALFEKLETLKALAQEIGFSVPAYVIAWLTSRPGIASVIAGCRNPAQLHAAAAGCDHKLPAEHAAKLDALFPASLSTGDLLLRWRDNSWELIQEGNLPALH